MTWDPQDISSGSFTFQPGTSYAILASVDNGKSTTDVTSYVQGKGFQVSYICEPPGGCTRNEYNIDTWLAGITAPARSGERWVYAEGQYTGTDPWTIPIVDSFPATLAVTYNIANIFMAVAAPAPGPNDNPVNPPLPSEPTTPVAVAATMSPWVAAGIGAAVGVVGGLSWFFWECHRATKHLTAAEPVANPWICSGCSWVDPGQGLAENPRKMTPTEREMVARYIRISAGHTYYLSTDELDRLIAKIENVAPATLTTTGLRKYAAVVGRNWAATQHRMPARRARASQREEKKRQEQLEREERARQKEAARVEFLDLLARLAPTLTPLQLKWLGVIRLSVFEGLRDPELVDRFPGTNRDVRYQWKHRGIELLQRYASANLMSVLDPRGGYRPRGPSPTAHELYA